MQEDQIFDNIYKRLDISSNALEEEILQAIDEKMKLIESGSISDKEQIKRISECNELMYDKEYRLRSMILFGSFGWNDLDENIKIIRDLIKNKKHDYNSWKEALKKLYDILSNIKFQEFVLDKCNLTKIENNDKVILYNAFKNISEQLIEYHNVKISQYMKYAQTGDAIEHFRIVNEFFILPLNNLIELSLINSSLTLLINFVKQSIQKIQGVIKNKSLSEKELRNFVFTTEKEVRDKILIVFNIVKSKDFKEKKEIVNDIKLLLENLISFYKENNYSNKISFYNTELSSLNDVKPDVKSEPIKVEEKIKVANTDFYNEIIEYLNQGKVNKAKNLFDKKRKEVRLPEEKQIIERILADPFFFKDKTIKSAKTNAILKYKSTSLKNENNDGLYILWLSLVLPLFPLSAYIFDKDNNEVGRVYLPIKYRFIQFLSLILFIGLMIFLSLNINIDPSVFKPKEKTIVEQVEVEEVHLLSALEPIVDELTSIDDENSDNYNQLLKKLFPLVRNIITDYKTKNKMNDFNKDVGELLFTLKTKQRAILIHSLFNDLQKYIFENPNYPSSFIDWILKMAKYDLSKKFIEELIIKLDEVVLKKNELHRVINIAKTYNIKINYKVINLLFKKNKIKDDIALLIIDEIKKFPKENTTQCILRIWKMESFLSQKEAMYLASKIGKNFYKDLRCDLLAIFLDENKQKVYKWEDEKLDFKYDEIDKRVKIAACLNLIRLGDFKRVVKIANTIPEIPHNNKFFYQSIPILYYRKHYDDIIYFLENKVSKNDFTEIYQMILGLAYFNNKKLIHSKKYLKPLIDKHFNFYVSLWKKLNERAKKIRTSLNKQLVARKGKYEAIARKIYLMQDEEEANIARENFIKGEINKDFNYKKIQAKIVNYKILYESIYSLIEIYIKNKDVYELRSAKNMLLSLRNEFFDFNTEILLGCVFYYSDKKQASIDIFKEIELKCINEKKFSPLIQLLKKYKLLGYQKQYNKLTKLITRKCKDDQIVDNAYRVLYDLSEPLNDKLAWLRKIKNKTLEDNIRLILLQIQINKNSHNYEELRKIYRILIKDGKKYLHQDVISLLIKLGDEFFYCYRIFNIDTSLDLSVEFFKKVTLKTPNNKINLNKYFNCLWFQFLNEIFISRTKIHKITENNLFYLLNAIDLIIEKNMIDAVKDNILSTDSLNLCMELFLKILNFKDPFIVIPPAFFQLLKLEEIKASFLESVKKIDLSSLKTMSFNEFWRFDLSNYNKMIYKETLEKEEKNLKQIKEEHSKIYAKKLLDWVEAVINDWIFSDEPLKMGFQKLIDNIQLSYSLDPTIRAKRLALEVKLLKISIWYDPNKKDLRKMSPSWVINKAINDGQRLKSNELYELSFDMEQLIKDYYPFYNEDLFIMLLLINKDYKINNFRVKDILELEKDIIPYKFKRETFSDILNLINSKKERGVA